MGYEYNTAQFGNVVIDEFSLIPLDISNYIFEISELRPDVNFIFVGDFIQLQPISIIRAPISLELLNSEFSDLTLSFNQSIRIADHLSNSVYVSKHFRESQKLILTHNYRNGTNVQQILNDVLNNYAFDKYIISNYKIRDFIKNGYVVLSSKYSLLQSAYTFYGGEEIVQGEISKIYKTKIGNIRIKIGDKFVLNENIDPEFVNGDLVMITELMDGNNVGIRLIDLKNKKDMKEEIDEKLKLEKHDEKLRLEKHEGNLEIDEDDKTNVININENTRMVSAFKLMPYNFITCHKAQGRTIPKVLLILDDLFEITMLYTAITRASEDVKFIKFKHLPNKTDIDAFNVMKDVIYKPLKD